MGIFVQPLTHITVRLGETGYRIGENGEKLPFGTILTELLNFPAEEYHRTLLALEQATETGNRRNAARAFRATVDLFITLPLYNRLNLPEKKQLEPTLLFRDTELGMMLASDSGGLLEKYRTADRDLQLIQTRYGWFLEELYRDTGWEKKRGQRKHTTAERLRMQGLDRFVGQVSLGGDSPVPLPRMSAEYQLFTPAEGSPELVEIQYFDRIASFAYVELMKGLQKGFIPKRCRNCGRWFLQQPGAEFQYCPGPAPGENGKTCREVGAASSFRNKIKTNELWQIHQRAYKKYFARVRKNTMPRAEFDTWARRAEQLRDQALVQYDRTSNERERAKIADALRTELNQL